MISHSFPTINNTPILHRIIGVLECYSGDIILRKLFSLPFMILHTLTCFITFEVSICG